MENYLKYAFFFGGGGGGAFYGSMKSFSRVPGDAKPSENQM